MPLPSINITFQQLGITAITRSEKGTVAVILFDEKEAGAHTLSSAADIPKELGKENKNYLEQAFIGYVNPPRRVLAYVSDSDDQDLTETLAYFATQQFDYLVGPPDLTPENATKIVSWVKSERLNDHTVKAVLPQTAADFEGVVNLATGEIEVSGEAFAPSEYCARVAGLIAGTPMTISCTYAPLPEVSGVERKTKDELDAAVDRGEFVLFHDGEKVKVGRGVNSLVTTTQEKGGAFQKIKIVEAIDMIKNDIRLTAQDAYIGKYANSYDNKCLLIMAVKGYLEELERTGILEPGTSEVGINTASQETYLKSQGIDTGGMSEQEIKEANTGSKVFLSGTVNILDAIEDIDIEITF